MKVASLMKTKCDKHDWEWDRSDDIGCPRCYEQVRILKGVQDGSWVGETLKEDIKNLTILIEGEY